MEGFDDPWEHIRLLSDRPRNEAMVDLLARHANGRTVLEVGCGTGMLSCIAARMGATRVLAVEPSTQADAARALVEANGLTNTVQVIEAAIEDLEPEPVDFAFSELLNAEPFAEGLLPVSRATAPWVKSGLLAPRRLEVYVALVREGDSATEVRHANAELDRLAKAYDLRTDPVKAAFADPGPYAFVSPRCTLASKPACIYASDLMDAVEPEDVSFEVDVDDPGPVGGVALWFRAELDDIGVITNAPGASGHWGVQILSWPELVGARRGRFALHAEADDTGFTILPR